MSLAWLVSRRFLPYPNVVLIIRSFTANDLTLVTRTILSTLPMKMRKVCESIKDANQSDCSLESLWYLYRWMQLHKWFQSERLSVWPFEPIEYKGLRNTPSYARLRLPEWSWDWNWAFWRDRLWWYRLWVEYTLVRTSCLSLVARLLYHTLFETRRVKSL